MDKDRVAPALGQITSGLFIATATVDEEPIGMLCSFVEQASFHPPMVTMALTPDRRLVEAFTFGNCKQVGLNILSTNNQNLIGPFANPNNEDPFEDVLLVEKFPSIAAARTSPGVSRLRVSPRNDCRRPSRLPLRSPGRRTYRRRCGAYHACKAQWLHLLVYRSETWLSHSLPRSLPSFGVRRPTKLCASPPTMRYAFGNPSRQRRRRHNF